MTKPVFSKISADAKDFIRCALNKNIDSRFSAKQMLDHSWMQTQSAKFEEPVDEDMTKDVFQNLEKFSKANRFQKTIASILIGLQGDKDDLKILKNVFNQLDKNNDGTLTMDEFKAAEKTMVGFKLGSKWSDILKKVDLDGDGKIDFDEFFTAAVDHQKYLTEENIKVAFNLFDTNGDGTIDVVEFR